MPTIALAAYSIYQGVQAGQQAKAAGKAAAAARQQQQAIGAEDQAYWRQTYGPVNQMLIDYAMGNKPSPYLAAAKGKVETGYQQGVTQLNELQGRAGLQQSGIGAGQKVGLNMERAKAEAGLNLQDQAQRYGIAQGLAPMISHEQTGMQVAGNAVGAAATSAEANAAGAAAASSKAFESAVGSLGTAWANFNPGDYNFGGGTNQGYTSGVGASQGAASYWNTAGANGQTPTYTGYNGQKVDVSYGIK